MSEFFDIYIIKNTRSKETVKLFNKTFLVEYNNLADEYKIPQYSDNSEIIHKNVEDLMDFLETNKKEKYSIYWKSEVNELYSQVTYTSDSHIVFGISTKSKNDCKKIFSKMSDFLKSDFGYITVENPPADNLDLFCTNFLRELEKDEIYKKFIPKDKFDLKTIENISISDLKAFDKLFYILLIWCQDMNWPIAKKIAELLRKSGDTIIPYIENVLDLNDEDWQYGIKSVLLQKMNL